MYVPGNPDLFSRVVSSSDNPLLRAVAINDANKVAANGWRVWVEHAGTGERIFESEAERAHQARSTGKGDA